MSGHREKESARRGGGREVIVTLNYRPEFSGDDEADRYRLAAFLKRLADQRQRRGGVMMAKEKELFRDNLMRLDDAFPGRDVLRLKEAAEYTEIPLKTVRNDKSFPKRRVGKNLFVSKTALASWLS